MNKIDKAAKKMETAIGRLETGLSAKDSATAARVSELRTALDQARSENASLQQAAEAACGRLDAAIKRVKAALEA